jgi:hypothetical protein
MLPLENLLVFALVSALLTAVPGPSVLFVIGRSLALGRRGGLLSVLGNAGGNSCRSQEWHLDSASYWRSQYCCSWW